MHEAKHLIYGQVQIIATSPTHATILYNNPERSLFKQRTLQAVVPWQELTGPGANAAQKQGAQKNG